MTIYRVGRERGLFGTLVDGKCVCDGFMSVGPSRGCGFREF